MLPYIAYMDPMGYDWDDVGDDPFSWLLNDVKEMVQLALALPHDLPHDVAIRTILKVFLSSLEFSWGIFIGILTKHPKMMSDCSSPKATKKPSFKRLERREIPRFAREIPRSPSRGKWPIMTWFLCAKICQVGFTFRDKCDKPITN